MMCEEEEKLVAFGHRNGIVSILDLRASGTVCSILQYEESDRATTCSRLGFVSDLAFLSSYNLHHQVLVKRSFGSCQLHDLRKFSSSFSTATDINTSPHKISTSVVRNMTVPSNEINPMLSANCSGFAVDPNGHQTMISPYIDSNSGASLGLWSLGTGHMVGSRTLQANRQSNSLESEEDTIYVEVCQRTTPSFSLHDNSVTAKRAALAVPSSSSSFSVWLKCGAFSRRKISSKVGSLHQITFPGNWN